jgi:hypothetical protein
MLWVSSHHLSYKGFCVVPQLSALSACEQSMFQSIQFCASWACVRGCYIYSMKPIVRWDYVMYDFIPWTTLRSPDRPSCSQSLYRLRYPAHRPAYTSWKRHRAWHSPLYPRPDVMRKSAVSMNVYSLTTFRAGSILSRHITHSAVSLFIMRTHVFLEEVMWRGMVAVVLPRFCCYADRSPCNERDKTDINVDSLRCYA